MEYLLELLKAPETYVSLLTLTALEVVLGIDNIIFITILSGKLPPEQRHSARRTGIAVALVSRLALLGAISWVMKLQTTLFTVVGFALSGKDLILIAGGLFLLAKATHEIYENVERPLEHQPQALERSGSLGSSRRQYVAVVAQVLLLDMVFSLDSVITAVGMARHVPVMVAAMILAVAIMLFFAGPVGDFVQRHASIRVLALSFLVLIAFLLIVEGLHQHGVPKGYVYFAMAFALGMELLNMRMRSRQQRLKEEQRQAAG